MLLAAFARTSAVVLFDPRPVQRWQPGSGCKLEAALMRCWFAKKLSSEKPPDRQRHKTQQDHQEPSRPAFG